MLSGSSTLHAVTGRAHFPSIFGPSVSLTPPAAQPPRMSARKERRVRMEEEAAAVAAALFVLLRPPPPPPGGGRKAQIKPDDHCRNDCRSGKEGETSS